MLEAALVFDREGRPLYWHTPPNRGAAHIPDSRDWWLVYWDNRENLGGMIHTHPWVGEPIPSHEDVTTWRALDKALGSRKLWGVATLDRVRYFRSNAEGFFFEVAESPVSGEDIKKLRDVSQ